MKIIKEKLIELDIMRSIAIIFIILLHLSDYMDYINIRIFPFGDYGLGLFVFLSGYLMEYRNSEIKTHKEIISFYKKRILKIYPLYWLALLTFIITFGIISPKFGYGSLISFKMSSFYMIVHMLGAQVLLAPRYLTPVFTLWFIGAILLYYLIYPVIVIRVRNNNELVARSVIIFILLTMIHFLYGIIDNRFFVYYYIFVSGIIVSYKNIFESQMYKNYSAFIPVIWLFLFMIDGANLINFNEFLQIIFFNILIIFFSMGLYRILNQFKNSYKESQKYVFSQISKNSYCIYLFHRPIISIIYGMNKLLHVVPVINDIIMISFTILILYIISHTHKKADSVARISE